MALLHTSLHDRGRPLTQKKKKEKVEVIRHGPT